MGIFDLIFDNIYVVVVVLFLVFKFIGSFTGNKKPTSMPTFGGDQPSQRDDDEPVEQRSTTYTREPAPETRNVESRPSQVAAKQETERYNKHIESAAPSYDEMKREQQRRQQLAKQRVAAAQKLMAHSPQSTQLGQKDLREAVIWSEILGKPRAKRPYRK